MILYQCNTTVEEIQQLEKDINLLKLNKGSQSEIASKQKQIEDKKNSYLTSGCINDLALTNCADLDYKILQVQNIIQNAYGLGDTKKADTYRGYLDGLKKEFENKKCEGKLNEFRTIPLQNAFQKYSQIDANRIETDSKKQATKRIIFGGIVLVSALAIIFVLGKRK